MDKRLDRPREGRMIGGVCAGIAQYLNTDVTVVRVVTVCLALFAGVGPLAYIAAWLIMPEQGADVSGLGRLVGQAQQWNDAPRASRTQQPETFDLYRDQH